MSDRDRQLPVLPSLGETLRPIDLDEADAVPMTGPLVDSYGRHIKNLRISVTDKCNFRCVYCMPADGLPWLPRSEILTFEEMARLSRVMVDLGVEQIRLTGGEPLVRRDLPELVRMLADIRRPAQPERDDQRRAAGAPGGGARRGGPDAHQRQPGLARARALRRADAARRAGAGAGRAGGA